MKASNLEGNIQLSSSLIFLYPVSKLSNKKVVFSSSGQPRISPITYIALEASETSLPNNSSRFSQSSGIEILLNILWLWGLALLRNEEYITS